MTDLSTLKPLSDHVLLRRIQEPDSKLLITPDSAKKPTHKGEVIAVGPGKLNPKTWRRRPMEVQSGQIVTYQSSDLETDDYVLIQEADILFVIEGNERPCLSIPIGTPFPT